MSFTNGKILPAAAVTFIVLVLLIAYSQLNSPNESLTVPDIKTSISSTKVNVHDARTSDLIFIGNSDIIIRPNMSEDETDILFEKYVNQLHFICRKTERYGNILDGGWDMCLVPPFIPSSPCLVYSFGINNDFSFDDAVAAKLKCTIRSFDPSMKVGEHKRGEHISFYKIGLDGKDYVNGKNWNMMTLSSILQKFGDSNKIIDYLKMDIEESEWPALDHILSSGVLSRVRQLGIEIHAHVRTASNLYERFLRLKGLEEAGMRRWYSVLNYYNLKRTKNGFRTCCFEAAYINVNFLPNWIK